MTTYHVYDADKKFLVSYNSHFSWAREEARRRVFESDGYAIRETVGEDGQSKTFRERFDYES